LIGKDGWWSDLEETMSTEKYCDYLTIHRFDPPKEHLGGLGNAGYQFASRNDDCDKVHGDVW
jgi:hypothetical protein